MSNHCLFLSAGDPSGDNAAARLITHLITSAPGLQVIGLGGARLRQLGQTQYAEPNDLAVLGFWEVAKRLGYFRALMTRCVQEIERLRPAAILLVDYPGFNLRLAARVRRLGIPIIYYISPQIWAWGRRRVRDIARLVDLMIVILPFEMEFYTKAGVRVEHVGHYLLDDIPRDYIGSPIPADGPLAILPGSRPQEVTRMLPAMLDAARLWHQTTGMTAVVAALDNGVPYDRYTAETGPFVSIVKNDARRVLNECRLALTASGTATLETGIIGRPMVIAYRTGWLTYQIARRLIEVPHIGLVNLVLGERLAPELIQYEAAGANMATALQGIATPGPTREHYLERIGSLPELLGGPGGSARAAELVKGYL